MVKKKTNLVNVVCERPLTLISSIPNRIVPFELVTSAAYRIRNGIEKTPCDVSLVRYELVLLNLILI